MDLIGTLSLLLIFLIVVIIVLALVYLRMSLDEKDKKNKSKSKDEEQITKVKSYKEYTIDSIYNFMEFDKVQDNMIIQKDGKRFLMAIECQGINYDLMSEIEKNSIEMGFMKLLNTLRFPIQIYIQTRTLNLENSLQRYKDKLQVLENELLSKRAKFKQMQENSNYSEEELKKQRLEVVRQENLCSYGKDIILNTERMNLNKNILTKKYYIIVSTYSNSSDGDYYDKDEVRDSAFSELYTRCQSIIRALAAAEVVGKVLTSNELVDLLYNSYNRDEAETYGMDKAVEAGYDDIYVTAPDVLEKRMVALDKKIEEEALNKAEEAILYATGTRKVKEKEESLDDLINEFAKQMIEENREYFSDEIIDTAKEQIEKMKGEKSNAKKTKKASK